MTLLKPRNLLLLLALLLAGGLALVAALRYRPPVEVAEVVKALPSGVDVALQDINYTHTEGGIARWRLVARQVEHSTSDRQTSLEALSLVFYDPAGAEQGTLRADRGQVNADFTVVEVRGAVEIVNRDGFTVTTERLTYRQEDRSIRTDAPVRLVGDGMKVDGVGLVMHLDTRRTQLLDKVRAVLVPGRAGQGQGQGQG